MRYIGLDLGSKTLGVAVSDITNTIQVVLRQCFLRKMIMKV